MKHDGTDAADWQQYMASRAPALVDQPALARFYSGPWPTADTPLEAVEFVALDVETTGLDVDRHAIVSIGLIPMTLARIRSNEAWHQVLRPPGELIAESVAFHRITHSDIVQAPRFADILEPLLERLTGRIAVVHYRAIERPFLDNAVRSVLGTAFQFPMVDTMEIEASLHPDRDPGWWRRRLGARPVSIRLADSRARYGLPPYHAHHALTDALATAELLQAQVATHFSPNQPLASLWC
jgi:DNA polymerase-3 subunit epsilon